MEEGVRLILIGKTTFRLTNKPDGTYKSEPLPSPQEGKGCPLCGGTKKILSFPKRVIGYTLAEGETTENTLDEHYKSCPLCGSQQEEEKGIPIVPQGRKLIAIIESQSNPGDKHYLYQEANGEIYCTCWGFRSPNKCWHYGGIKEAIDNGEIDLDKLKEPIRL